MRTDKNNKRIPNSYCSCGALVYGNGAWASHRKKHKRLADGHHAVTRDQWKPKS